MITKPELEVMKRLQGQREMPAPDLVWKLLDSYEELVSALKHCRNESDSTEIHAMIDRLIGFD